MERRQLRSLALGLGLLIGGLAPAQDECSTAVLIGNGLTIGTNVGATVSFPAISCTTNANDVWYRYVPTTTGQAIASFCSPGWATFDTVLSAWNGHAGCSALMLLACNDDLCSVQSEVAFQVQAGKPYYISVAGYGGAAGNFALNVSCTPGSFTPPGDSTIEHIQIQENRPIAGTNVNAGTGGTDPPPCGAMGSDVWFEFIATQSGPYVATTCFPATTFDTKLGVWDDPWYWIPTLLVCDDDSCSGFGSSHNVNTTSYFTATAGAKYLIEVGGYLSAQGDFVVSVGPVGTMRYGFISSGPGTLGYLIEGGPPLGPYLSAITLSQGAYPNGWFFGIDIGLLELNAEIGASPFWGNLDPCGQFKLGPLPNLPPGLIAYGVGIAALVDDDYNREISLPATGTIP